MAAKNELQQFLKDHHFSKIVVLADETILKLYPQLIDFEEVSNCIVIPIVATEKNKQLNTCQTIFTTLLAHRIDKNALLINIGGGITTDIGGFVAATYKRGLAFVNVPTTLLGMIDAAVGGKNGVNVGEVKNAVGTISLPERIFIAPKFLNTLPYSELLNGFGELVKYALIGMPNLWANILKIKKLETSLIEQNWIDCAIRFKEQIVARDLHDHGERRLLNFGHTVGHALESYFLAQNRILPHGHAVAIGICCATFISFTQKRIEKYTFQTIFDQIQRFFDIPHIPQSDFQTILQFCKNDKKNSDNYFNMTLLNGIGSAIPNVSVTASELLAALNAIFD